MIYMFFLLSYVCLLCCFVFFKRMTAYVLRISDWSSDVCSSDLHRLCDRAEASTGLLHRMENVQQVTGVAGKAIGGRHHQHVAGIERADRALELGPLGRRGADLLAVDLGAAGRVELGELLRQILPVG